MYRLIKKFVKDPNALAHATLLIVAVTLLVVGLYVVGPWYVGGPTTSMGQFLEEDLIRAVPAVLYIVSGGIGAAGVFLRKPRWRYSGSFLCCVSYAFLLGLRLFTFGFTPIIWVFILALGLVSAIIFLWEAGRDTE
jgi:hypothetical protein